MRCEKCGDRHSMFVDRYRLWLCLDCGKELAYLVGNFLAFWISQKPVADHEISKR